MRDLKEKLEKLRADADDCYVISRFATAPAKRKLFARLAAQLRKMAEDVEAAIADGATSGES